jgi:hypothetical protein
VGLMKVKVKLLEKMEKVVKWQEEIGRMGERMEKSAHQI